VGGVALHAGKSALGGLRRWHPKQQGQFLDDGSYELRVPYADNRELIMDIMKYGSDCQVIEPAELQTKVAAELQRGLMNYRG
jgi:proteasome accessory factor C